MLKHLVIDVDGTLTDAGVYYDEHGNEMKKFCTRDGAAFFAMKSVGVELIILTGRECAATLRRMTELKADIIKQNVKDKAAWLESYMTENGINKDNIGFIGDDLNDYQAMQLCGFKACPADAAKEIKEICNYISSVPGGHGAVRDICEHILTIESKYNELLAYYGVI